jgi:diketogulonate reductase-like aldo/keto reductase
MEKQIPMVGFGTGKWVTSEKSDPISIPSLTRACRFLHFYTWIPPTTGGLARPADSVRSAISVGFRHFDLAEAYANQEELGVVFAEAFASNPRKDFFITSKLWCTNMAPDHVGKAARQTMQDLHVDYLDLYLLHWPVPMQHTGIQGPKEGKLFPVTADGRFLYARGFTISDVWREMERLVDEGLVHSIGVSNFPAALLHDLLASAAIPPAVNQVEMHPSLPQTALLDYCRLQGIKVVASTPLGGHGSTLLREPLVVELSKKYQRSAAQILLRWNVQRGVAVIPLTENPAHQRENLAVASEFELSMIDMQRLDQHANSRARSQRYISPPAFEFLWH